MTIRNEVFRGRGLTRFEDLLGKATLSTVISDILTAELAKHVPSLVANRFHNGKPDTLPAGMYPGDSMQAADEGIEVKVTNKQGDGFDAHGTHTAWYFFARLDVDRAEDVDSHDRRATSFKKVSLARLDKDLHFRRNDRDVNGTRTASPNKLGLEAWALKHPDLIERRRAGGRALRTSGEGAGQ